MYFTFDNISQLRKVSENIKYKRNFVTINNQEKHFTDEPLASKIRTL